MTMTYGEVMIQILHEVTGRPKSVFREITAMIQQAYPGQHRLDAELSPDEAAKLLDELRQEKPGILNWLIEGNRRAQQKIRDAQQRRK